MSESREEKERENGRKEKRKSRGRLSEGAMNVEVGLYELREDEKYTGRGFAYNTERGDGGKNVYNG